MKKYDKIEERYIDEAYKITGRLREESEDLMSLLRILYDNHWLNEGLNLIDNGWMDKAISSNERITADLRKAKRLNEKIKNKLEKEK